VEPIEPPDADSALMIAFQKGDALAFEQIVNKYGKIIVNFLYKFVNDRAEAEDLAQEVFLRVYRARNSYEPRAPLSAWLYRIAGNVGLRAAGRRRRSPVLATSGKREGDTEPLEAFQDPRADPERLIVEAETGRIVLDAIRSLPEKERMALLLRRYEGLSYKDIAGVMECTEGAVKTYLHRGKLRLRDRVLPHWRKGSI